MPELRATDEVVQALSEVCTVVEDTFSVDFVMNLGAGSDEIFVYVPVSFANFFCRALNRHKAFLLQSLTSLFIRFYGKAEETEQMEMLFSIRDNFE